jgi:predicted 2-oxoglutarate/Fe(II)-dependent dioxygenase YbiX
MMHIISKDFKLDEYNIKLTHPGDQFLIMDNSLTIDKRIVGNSLGPHADVPTGTFAKEKGVFFEDGTSPITMSCVFYWNDDFEGGELELYFSIDPKDLIENPQSYDFSKISSDYTYKPVAGDLVVFPSHVVHAIKPITKGTRYSTQYFYEREYSK